MREDTQPIIYIVGDEVSVLKGQKRRILSMGMKVKTYTSGQEFLNSNYRDNNACLITDIKMPDMNGIELQQKLIAKNSKLPVIMISAFDSEIIRSKAKEAGASGYFKQPVDDQALLDSIQWALSNQPT